MNECKEGAAAAERKSVEGKFTRKGRISLAPLLALQLIFIFLWLSLPMYRHSVGAAGPRMSTLHMFDEVQEYKCATVHIVSELFV
jgi:hypothetical protein